MRSKTEEFCSKSLAFVGLVDAILAALNILGIAAFRVPWPLSSGDIHLDLAVIGSLLFSIIGLLIFARWMRFGWLLSASRGTPIFWLVSTVYQALILVGVVTYSFHLLQFSKTLSTDLLDQADLRHIAFFCFSIGLWPLYGSILSLILFGEMRKQKLIDLGLMECDRQISF